MTSGGSLAAWLEGLGLGQYAGVFAENGVDLDALPLLTDGDLEQLGVLLGHRRRLLKALGEARHRWTGLPLGRRPRAPSSGGSSR